ncbi:thioredoxin reductase 1, cytoplasmic [Trichonephila inaurata madagascariensis]|uniref:Thioredoxin reductase 1, cytoplasmic n=1 Tax=Trichonephila inaurata madagascariensis TaxID=2747483 RepID=A0A8X6MH57_9ARAC|nr:thioredoxin reductase 1, cytoplasmic [Trichonephila inaurata madagascariensis]
MFVGGIIRIFVSISTYFFQLADSFHAFENCVTMAPVPESDKLLQEVDNYIRSNDVMIFSKTTCPFCNKVKALLSSMGIQFTVLELDTLENGPQMQKAMAERVGRSSVPQVFIRGQHCWRL